MEYVLYHLEILGILYTSTYIIRHLMNKYQMFNYVSLVVFYIKDDRNLELMHDRSR